MKPTILPTYEVGDKYTIEEPLYLVSKKKASKHTTGTVVQDCDRHVTLRTRHYNVCVNKTSLLTGEVKLIKN